MPPKINPNSGVKQGELWIFYVIDNSGSMSGAPIAALNDGMRTTYDELKKINGEKAEVRVILMVYNDTANWIGENVVPLEDMEWTNLSAGGMTNLGDALDKLDEFFSNDANMVSETGFKPPVIIFMSDGKPTSEWESSLKKLAQNKWYRYASKIAFALGDHADIDMLAKVVGVDREGVMAPEPSHVIRTNQLEAFTNLIRYTTLEATNFKKNAKGKDDNVTAIIENATEGEAKTGPKGETVYNPTLDPPIYGVQTAPVPSGAVL